ncbi:Afadin [Armadillidium nasatum]|uniref:Afadin n=1 Tax=Armadillidium nasatum TaxID=96803 RepID=A0A5N5TFT2_9CRUS|nr:Afadin [Armadillidium nasatum]
MTYTSKDTPIHSTIPSTFNIPNSTNLGSHWKEFRRRRLLPDVVALRTSQEGWRELFSPIPEENEEGKSNSLSDDENLDFYEKLLGWDETNSWNLDDLIDHSFNKGFIRNSPNSSEISSVSQDNLKFEVDASEIEPTDTESALQEPTFSGVSVDSKDRQPFPLSTTNPQNTNMKPIKPEGQVEFGSNINSIRDGVRNRSNYKKEFGSLCCTLSRMRQVLIFQDFLRGQFESLQDELERRREECIQLRTVLANQATEKRSLIQSSYGKDVDLVNEDGELVLALQSQKQINRQLMEELNEEKVRSQESEAEYRAEVNRLREQNERQQKLIGENLMKGGGGGGSSETLLQSEIIRLTSENLSLQSQVDSLTEQLKKYKRTVKIYSKKLKEVGGVEPSDTFETEIGEKEGLPVIRKKDREYMGMFEYDRREEKTIIKVLIYELKPRVAVTLLPGLPSYILFMCIRHTDHINDDEKVRSLLNNIVTGVKRVIKKRHEDLDSTVLWLSNTLRLLHNLKQYSGEKAFQGVIKLMEEKVQPLIVPAILEHEAITGLSGNKPGGMRGRAGSVARELESPVEPQKALDLLLKELTQFYRTLAMFGTDPEIITQVFRQLFYFVCAGALNNLLLRKDMCHWSKGMQIRYNLTHLEQWTRDMRLHEAGVTDTLAPIIQAAQLLQARKTDEDVNSVCDMCDKLSVSQIIKILNLYTPADDFEERVPASFIEKIKAKLEDRAEGENAQDYSQVAGNTRLESLICFIAPGLDYGTLLSNL